MISFCQTVGKTKVALTSLFISFILKDSLFNKIEKKTNINKDTILKLADKLQKNNMKDENTIREIINDISNMTGKEVSKEKADKIVNAIKNDKVPKNLDKML